MRASSLPGPASGLVLGAGESSGAGRAGGAVCLRRLRAPFMRGGGLGAGHTGRQPSHVVAGCAGQGPVRPRTCAIGAQRPALSEVCAAPHGREEAPGPGGCGWDLGRRQRWPAALRRDLSPCRPLLASGPESTHGTRSPSPAPAGGSGPSRLLASSHTARDTSSRTTPPLLLANPVCPEGQGRAVGPCTPHPACPQLCSRSPWEC